MLARMIVAGVLAVLTIAIAAPASAVDSPEASGPGLSHCGVVG